MNQLLLSSSIALLTISSAQAAVVSITSAKIRDYRTAGTPGTTITTAGVLGILVLNTGTGVDGFGGINSGTNLANGVTLADGNDVIINIIGSKAGDAFNPAEISGTGTGTVEVDLDGIADAGDEFAVYWFPTLTTSSGTFTTGDAYGTAREANWFLPSSGTTPTPTLAQNVGSANFTVAPVPEPSSVALLGLGSAALLLRRRRK